ncbi:MAG: response regulator [Chloroflexi bacterium]|nr:response regulator [Chloroflexota bacterium]
MADVKQILVVDDHFEMLEFMRTVLQHSGRDYQVLAVPSAEEGMLELLRTPFDLLITDVRLPGMSGFDLIRRVRRARPELPVIMISGYGIEQGQKEAAALGVVHYFVKPLDSDLLLLTVQRTLFGEPVVEPPAPEPTPAAAAVPFMPSASLSRELIVTINQRLHTLRNEISATYVVLADAGGRIQTDSGMGKGLASPDLLNTVATSLRHNQLLAEQLGNEDAITLQYQSGTKAELYAMSVGSAYQILIFFTAETRRGRVGTVWVFAQRLVKELLPLLPTGVAIPSAPVPETPTIPSRTVTQARKVADLPDFPSKTPSSQVERALSDRAAAPTPPPVSPSPPPPEAPSPPPLIPAEFILEANESADAATLNNFWDQAVEESTVGNGEAFSFAEAMRQGLIPGGLGQPLAESGDEAAETALADWLDFSDEAMPDELLEDWLDDAAADKPVSGEEGEGLSFAEAMRLGLLPGELTQEPSGTPDDAVLANLFALAPEEALDLDAFWDEAINQSLEDRGPDSSTQVQAHAGDDEMSMDLDAMLNTPSDSELDLDAFWASAVTDEQGDAAATTGLSLAEAVEKGLFKADSAWEESE